MTVSAEVLNELEKIDDDTDTLGIPFVRIDDDSVAKEFGILDELPILVYFENKVPSVYEGNNLFLYNLNMGFTNRMLLIQCHFYFLQVILPRKKRF